jgi:hypothetical protein
MYFIKYIRVSAGTYRPKEGTYMDKKIAEAVERLNETGRQIVLQQVKALQTAYPKEPEESEDPEPLTWTGYFRGARREGSIIYPEWG